MISRWMVQRLARCAGVIIAALLVGPFGTAHAHNAPPPGTDVTTLVGFDQRLGASVPRDLPLVDESGQAVTLQDYLRDKPVILALSYFECDALCPMVRQGIVDAVRPLKFTVGDEFDVLLVSIDPDETPEIARRVKQETVAAYGRDDTGRGWHFLTGEHAAVDKLADAIGFRFTYDAELDEYAHPSGIVLLTPDGHISRYFFGIEYDPQDVRLGLVESTQNKIAGPIDRLLLLCYHYDPTVGKYSLMIMNVVRAAGGLTVALMGGWIWLMWRRDPNRQRRANLPHPESAHPVAHG